MTKIRRFRVPDQDMITRFKAVCYVEDDNTSYDVSKTGVMPCIYHIMGLVMTTAKKTSLGGLFNFVKEKKTAKTINNLVWGDYESVFGHYKYTNEFLWKTFSILEIEKMSESRLSTTKSGLLFIQNKHGHTIVVTPRVQPVDRPAWKKLVEQQREDLANLNKHPRKNGDKTH